MRKVVWTAVTIYFEVWRLQSSELKDWITFREEGGERDAACISEWNIMAVENKVAIRNDNFFSCEKSPEIFNNNYSFKLIHKFLKIELRNLKNS